MINISKQVMRRVRCACTILTVSLMSLSVSALTVTVDSPGTLRGAVGENTTSAVLKVCGKIDAGDLYFIGREMPALTDLDLSEAVITAYAGSPEAGATLGRAGELPTAVFAGLPLTRFVYPTEGNVTIGDGAFAGTAFYTHTLPANVVGIGDGAFAGCLNLKQVEVPGCRLGTGIFAGCTNLEKCDVSKVKVLPPSTFKGCSNLSEVIGGGNVEELGDAVFESCSSLRSFDFGRNLSVIGRNAFACSGIESAQLKNSHTLKNLGDGAFAQCGNLSVVELPWDFEKTGNDTFMGDKSLTAIIIPEEVAELGDNSFAGAGLKGQNPVLGGGLVKIGRYALAGNRELTHIVLPSTLEEIGDGAMQDVSALEHITAVAPQQPARLGERVWAGVVPGNVTLLVPEEKVDDYKAAPQWQDFKIVGKSGVIDTEVVGGGDPSISFAVSDGILTVRSVSEVLTNVAIYDTDGRLMAAVSPGSHETKIDITSLGGKIMIVSATAADGAKETVKFQ